MKFEIKLEIDFEIGELASQVLEEADYYLAAREPNYEDLDDKQRDELLKAIFSKALEILKEED